MSSELKQINMCMSKYFSPSNENEIDNTKLKAFFHKKNIWPQFRDITLVFIGDGEDISINPINRDSDVDPLDKEIKDLLTSNPRMITIKEAIKRIVRERIEPLVNFKFNFIEDQSKAMVKISLGQNFWPMSSIGYYGDGAGIHNMSFGTWFDVRVILHEFGHLIGLVHEQENPNGKIAWDREAVLKFGKIQGWTDEQTEMYVLYTEKTENINGSTFDPLSIMVYPYPAELNINKIAIKMNARLSGKDVLWICKTYPKQNEDPRVTAENFYQRVYGESLQSSIDKSERMAAVLTVQTVPPVTPVTPVQTVQTVPPVTPVQTVQTVPPVPSKSNSTILIVFGIIFGLIIILGSISIFILRIKGK